jgi:hypothetical protein
MAETTLELARKDNSFETKLSYFLFQLRDAIIKNHKVGSPVSYKILSGDEKIVFSRLGAINKVVALPVENKAANSNSKKSKKKKKKSK